MRHAWPFAVRRRPISSTALLGVTCAAASIVAVVSPLGRHWTVFAVSSALLVVSGGLFMRRWARRGVFRELQAHQLVRREET